MDHFLSFVNVFFLTQIYRGFEDGEGYGPAPTGLRRLYGTYQRFVSHYSST